MTESRKKQVYIGIIGFCLLGTAYVLFFLNGDSPAPAPTTVTTTTTTTPPAQTAADQQELLDPSAIRYSAPAVFPVDSRFSTQALTSTQFQSLQSYDVLTVSPEETGRENPFATY